MPVTYVPARNTIFLVVRAGVGRGARRRRHLHRRERARLLRAIPIAGRSTSRRSSGWRISRRVAASRARIAAAHPRSAHRPHQGADHSTRHVARRRLRDHAELLRSRSNRRRVRPLRRLPAASEGIRRSRIADPARIVDASGSAHLRPPVSTRPHVHRQRDLLHASGRGRERRQAGGVLSFLGVQSVDGTRGGSRDGDLRFLRHRLRRRRTGRRQVRDGRRARRRGGRAMAGRDPAEAGSSSAPAASRCSSSTRRRSTRCTRADSRSPSRRTAPQSRRAGSTGSA